MNLHAILKVVASDKKRNRLVFEIARQNTRAEKLDTSRIYLAGYEVCTATYPEVRTDVLFLKGSNWRADFYELGIDTKSMVRVFDAFMFKGTLNPTPFKL